MTYGLFDTLDKLWLGSDSGPKTFSSEDVINGKTLGDDGAFLMARIAAQLADTTLGWEPGRTRAMELPKDEYRIRDEVKLKMSTLEALQRTERGIIV